MAIARLTNIGDVLAVQQVLQAARPFRFWAVPNLDPYDIFATTALFDEFGGALAVVLDRNVFSRALELFTPERPPAGKEHRIAAAVFAYCIWTGAYFDPVIATAETVFTNRIERGRGEAVELVAMQNIHPQPYVDVALGRADRIPSDVLAVERTVSAIQGAASLELDQWDQFRADYGAALKLAMLLRELGEASPTPDTFVRFLEWSYHEFILVLPAIIYGSLALSPRRISGMFKDVRVGKSADALRGVRNATWDMAMLRYFMKLLSQSKAARTFPIACSLDRALLHCLDDLVGIYGQPEAVQHQRLNEMFCRHWGDQASTKVAAACTRCVLGQQTDSRRAALQPGRNQADWEAMVHRLEKEFVAVCGEA